MYKNTAMQKTVSAVLLSLIFWGCIDENGIRPGSVMGYVPVYAKPENLTDIGIETAKATEKAGKIYVIGNLMLQNDVNKGVHFVDISNRNQPRKISFLRVPWSTEISVKNNHLYINNFNDLLVFNIANTANPVLVKRLANVFPYHNSEYPSANSGYFECADPSKGIVVDWKLQMIDNPKCRR
jgi:hypothetical protein